MDRKEKDGYNLEELLGFGRRFDVPEEEHAGEVLSTRLAADLLRIRDRSGGESPLVANPVQAAFARARGRQNIVLKARQMGLTTWVAGRFFLKTVTARGVLTVQVAHTQKAAESIFVMVDRFWRCLPEGLRKGPLKRSRANVGQMIFPALDSEFRVLTAADENAGRGLTVQNMHLSEVSRWPGDAAATLAGMRAALVPAGELVLESTPNGAYGCFYQEWLQAEANGMVKHFFPWWLEPEYAGVEVTDPNEEEAALMQQHGLSAAQIGFRRGLEASYRGLRVQEFVEDPELCFRSSGECCFDLDALETRLKTVEKPVATERRGRLQIFLPPQPGKQYIVAVDPAGGGAAGDYSAVQVIDQETGAQCAELQQRLNPLELSKTAAELARRYSTPGHPALLAVERNNHGFGVLAHLQEGERYANLYDHDGVPGWLTNGSSKQEMVSGLGALLVGHPELFRSSRLLEECRSFVTHANSRTGAASGAHDDCVMAFAIAQAVRKQRQAPPRKGGG
jgi:hypothetical protein